MRQHAWITGSAAVAVCLALFGLSQWSVTKVASRSDSHRREAGAERREKESEAPGEQAWWDWRVSYPTGRYNAAWYDSALPQHRSLAKGLPDAARGKAMSAPGILDASRATALGPAPLDWTSDYGFVAGRVNVIVTHPTRPNVAWFGADGGGVWKTVNCCDASTTWQVKTDTPQIANIAVSALVLDPNDANTLYAGTGDFERNRAFAFGASGLLKSVDGGENWQALATDVFTPVYAEPAGEFPQRRSISAIAIDPRASRNLIVGTNQGLYFSHDAGVSWQGPCFTNGFATQRQDVTSVLAVADDASSSVIVAIGSLIRESTVRADLGNNGANGIYRASVPATGCPATWSVLSRGDNGWPAGSASGIANRSGGNPLARIDLAVAPSDNHILYAQVMHLGVWRSGDAGATWTQTATQPESFASGCDEDSYDNGIGFEDYNAGLMVSPGNPDTVFLSSIDLWRSTDGARTFVDLTCSYAKLASGAPGNVHPDNHARAAVAADERQLLIGNDGGVYASADALAQSPVFTALNGGADTIEFYSGDLTAQFDDASVPTRGIVGSAQDNGSAVHIWDSGVVPARATWLEAFGGDGTFAKIEPILQQRWYYSAQFGYIVASSTGPNGTVDQLVTPEDPSTYVDWQGDRTGFLTPFDLYKFGDERSCPAASGCQRMIAGTYRVWESLSGGLPNTSWYINSPDLTKALGDDADLSIVNKVAFAYSESDIAVAGTNDGNVWVGFELGSGSENSAAWVNVTAGNAVLPNRPIMDVRTDPVRPTTVYASLAGFDQNTPATPGHVYKLVCDARCTNFSWANKSGNLPNIPVNAILVNPNLPSQAFAGTDWGLYFTDDIDASPPQWKRFDGGLPSAMIWDLVIDRGATTLAIFTRSRGAYVWPLPRTATLPPGPPQPLPSQGPIHSAPKPTRGYAPPPSERARDR